MNVFQRTLTASKNPSGSCRTRRDDLAAVRNLKPNRLPCGLQIPELAESDELGESGRFFGPTGLVLELDQATRQGVALLPKGDAVDAADHMVVAHTELDARIQRSDHEPTEFTAPDFAPLYEAVRAMGELV